MSGFPLADGYTDLPSGKIAAVVTYLEMLAAPARIGNVPAPEGVSVELAQEIDLERYRRLYRAIGEDWLWFSRLFFSDDRLRAVVHSPEVDLLILRQGGEDKGLFELDRRGASVFELAFFGLTADLVGKGLGRYLMSAGLQHAWSLKPERLFVHTCTLDHPRAVEFYVKSGFVPYKRALEIADDPRANGQLPRSAAPHIPFIPA